MKITKRQLRRLIREAISAVDVDTGEVWESDLPDKAWPDLVRRLGLKPLGQDEDGNWKVDGDAIEKLGTEVDYKKYDRKIKAQNKRLDPERIRDELMQWAEDAGADYIADNPGADLEGIASDLARSAPYNVPVDEWEEVVWDTFDNMGGYDRISYKEAEEMLYTTLADAIASGAS